MDYVADVLRQLHIIREKLNGPLTEVEQRALVWDMDQATDQLQTYWDDRSVEQKIDAS